jgi:hypothetical protein
MGGALLGGLQLTFGWDWSGAMEIMTGTGRTEGTVTDTSFGPALALGLLLRSPAGRLGPVALRGLVALWLGNGLGFLVFWLALGAFAWERTLVAAALETARTGFCGDGTLLANDGSTTFGDGTILDADGNIWSAEGDSLVHYSPVRGFVQQPEWPVRVTKAWEATPEMPRLGLSAANQMVAAQQQSVLDQGLGLLEDVAAQSLGALAVVGGGAFAISIVSENPRNRS